MVNPIAEFKAIYNPFTRTLLVRYGTALVRHTFEETEEWAIVNYNNDDEQPQFLHIQLDYDETAQLLFYPRVDGDESLHEELGTYYNSLAEIPDNIRIVTNDFEWNVLLVDFLGGDAEGLEYEEFGESTYHSYNECVLVLAKDLTK